MPIEIRELHIRVTVSPPPPETGTPSPSTPDVDTKALVAACVEQVLQVLRDQAER